MCGCDDNAFTAALVSVHVSAGHAWPAVDRFGPEQIRGPHTTLQVGGIAQGARVCRLFSLQAAAAQSRSHLAG